MGGGGGVFFKEWPGQAASSYDQQGESQETQMLRTRLVQFPWAQSDMGFYSHSGAMSSS